MILVRYCGNSKAYRLMNPREHSNKIYKRKDVDVIEIQDESHQIITNKKNSRRNWNKFVNMQTRRWESRWKRNRKEYWRKSIGKKRSIDVEDTDGEAQQTRRYPLRARKPKEFPNMVTYQAICEDSNNLEPLTVRGFKQKG